MIYQTTQAKFLLFLILFLGTSAGIFAADGDLDATFGNGGIVTTDNGSDYEGIYDLAVQADGKIIAAGASFAAPSLQTVVVRYNADGTIDSTFGSSGKVFIEEVFPNKLAVQPNGKIVLVGFRRSSSGRNFYVARLNSNGSFDTAFNGTGEIIMDLSGEANSVKIQSDGKILVGGTIQEKFAVFRFNVDGSLDTAFGDAGKVFTPLQDSAEVYDLAIQTDGKIVAVGESFLLEASSQNPQGSFATVRYNPDGSIDTTFNGNGIAFTEFVSNGSSGIRRNNTPRKVLIRPNGKIVVVGTTSSCCVPQPLSQIALIQYNPDGSIDTSFGNAGKTQTGLRGAASSGANDAALQSDGKILVAGNSQSNIKSNLQTLVGRFNSNGSFDETFNVNGLSSPQFPANTTARTFSIALQPDSKFLIGGNIRSNREDFFLAQFEFIVCRTESCSGEKQEIADFDGDGKTDASVFRNGTWFINPSVANNPNSYYSVQFGVSTDKLTPADFDGDGKTDIAIWRENVIGTLAYFYILQSSTNTFRVEQFGQTGDDPRIVGDWDGDGRADLAVYRSGAQSRFYYRPSSQPSIDFVTVNWGTSGDEAVRGDFDGDGKMDAAIFRPSNNVWYIMQSLDGRVRYEDLGFASDKRVVGDFDGDGKSDLAIYRDGVWVVQQSSDNQRRYAYWGLRGDSVVAGDYDGDGKTDFAVWRNGVYYILQNTDLQPKYQQFGVAGDIPAASAFIR